MDEHVQTINIEERRVAAKPTEVLKGVPLDENKPKRFTRIGASMEDKTKQDFVQLLKKSIDVFVESQRHAQD